MDAVSSQSRAFLGVRFVLAGFRDDDYCRNVGAKLVGGGGVDVGRYGPDCTHVIVDGLVYDDPVCVAARKNMKTVVTGLWVDHSYDIGMAVDATSIMYSPLKGINGVPGGAMLMVCLTGYQRQDRDDIMTMVRLMGAQFSKPLVANKVTHLICYKFEGEKYELAKKMKKIKLVNHLWLEDCLREWEILPETNYSKSGYELEMEAEVNDSEEEGEDRPLKHCQESVAKKSPILKLGIPNSSMSPVLKEHLVVSSPKGIMLADREIPSNNEFHCQMVDGPKTMYSLIDADAELLPMASNIKKEFPPTSRSAGTPQSDAKISTLSYSRRTSRKSVSPPGKDESGYTDFMKMKFSRSNENVVKNSLTDVTDKIICSFYDVQTPSKATEVRDEEFKGKAVFQGETEVSSTGPKLAKISSSPSHGSKLELGATALMDKQGFASSVLISEKSILHYAEHEKVHFPASEEQRSTSGQIASDLPLVETINFGSVVGKDDSKKTSPTSSSMLPNSILESKHVIQGINDEQPEYQINENTFQPQLRDGLSPIDQDTGITTAFDAAKVYFAEEGKNKAVGSTERKKFPAKTLGRKRNVPTSANAKGSIYLAKGNAESDIRNSCELPRQELSTLDKSSNANETEMPDLTGVVPVTEEVNGTEQCQEFGVPIYHEMNDETEAPEEICEPSREKPENESHRVNLIEKADIGVEETIEITAEAVLHGFASDKMKEAPKQNEVEKHNQDQLSDEPKQLSQSEKNAKGSKRPLSTRKLKAKHVENNESVDMGSPSSPIVKQKIEKKQSNVKSSVQFEKENQPLDNSDSDGNKVVARAVKSGCMKRSIKKVCKDLNSCKKTATVFSGDKIEPACFIINGERQQRMQLRKVIRSLNGKLCTDSHYWSYQATHFICQKPARTEKWFAACASGRWILQQEYLSACNQEGKFLDEEPYEWHKIGLSQDGAINLEAPRKWRLLRQRTGHGAFDDMHIIVYGECIAPSLETLKRVVKAGDGTILATSPPYTRFLNGKTDFAIISPGMPRVDAWIQEFIKHEIPCVVADYLVEYVCKPGYSLDKHVLYNTHSWAERSFSRLQVKTSQPDTPNDGSSDICCDVCGSSDREEVMLLCGDETGSVGCGAAAHIDCCDPPLEAVPKENWLCPKCSIQATKNTSSTIAASKRKRLSR